MRSQNMPQSNNIPTTSVGELDYSLAGYDYNLPPEQIAQNPVSPRDSARLLVVSQSNHSHHIFHELPQLLKSGDLLVMNNTRVIPARLHGQKASGAMVEVLLLEEQQHNVWLALVKPGKRLQPGAKIFFTKQGDKEAEGAEVAEGEFYKPSFPSPLAPHHYFGPNPKVPA